VASREGEEDVVRIMSVHRSKGLEFPVVVLPDLGRRSTSRTARARSWWTARPDWDAGGGRAQKGAIPVAGVDARAERLRQQALAEEMRVLYRGDDAGEGALDPRRDDAGRDAPALAARWTGHEGPLPADVCSGRGPMLDWLGPVAAATAPPRGDVFRVTRYSGEDVLAWAPPSRRATAWSDAQARMARLEKLDPPAPPHRLGRCDFTAHPTVRFRTVHPRCGGARGDR
jgi:hypothetical protein